MTLYEETHKRLENGEDRLEIYSELYDLHDDNVNNPDRNYVKEIVDTIGAVEGWFNYENGQVVYKG